MGKLRVPLKEPKPDIETFCAVVRREKIPPRPPLVELFVDQELMSYLMGKQLAGETGIPYQNLINLYLRDCVQSHRKISMKWAS